MPPTTHTKKRTHTYTPKTTAIAQHLCQPPNCNQLTITEPIGRDILARLVTRFLPFYNSITKEQFEVLQLFKYGAVPFRDNPREHDLQIGHNYNINEFLFSDTFTIEAHQLLYNKEFYDVLYNMNKVVNPKYKELAKYMRLSDGISKEYIINSINNIVSHSVNTLTTMFANPHIQHLSALDTVYRGLGNCFIDGKQIGDTITFTNFMYTSVSCKVACKFASNSENGNAPICLCKLIGLHGVPFLHILNYLYFSYTKRMDSILNSKRVIDSSDAGFCLYEILLHRNNQFKISAITKERLYDTDVTMYTLEFIKQLPIHKITKKHVATKKLAISI